MSNSSGVEFIDENASEDVTPRLYQVKRLPTKKVPKIISLITKVGIPIKYAEYVAFGLLSVIFVTSLWYMFTVSSPKVYKISAQEKQRLLKLTEVPGSNR